jgi:predicted metal-dependent hydrolase
MGNRTFCYEDVSINYTLIEEHRKTISITVFPDTTVFVKAPDISNKLRIESYIQKKCRWILKQQRYFAQFKAPKSKEYVSGETFLYLGRAYKLIVNKAEDKERVSLLKGKLTIYSKDPHNNSRTKKMVDSWYASKRNQAFEELLANSFTLFRYPQKANLKIRTLNKRWGSYLKKTNTIVLNPDLIMASKKQIQYVIIHELCHVIHKNHNNAFYSLLSAKLPNWEKIKIELELKLLSR